jgi:L-cysteine:1D-myo-inositol 2-amino-2-deoxy-alpha-D-glucopyranoside ligase
MATGLSEVDSMKTWPDLYLPTLDSNDFPTLKLKDTNYGDLKAILGDRFKMYVCGITPYDATHLGHAATYLSFDLINRYKRLSGATVSFVENITDIDDPLFERANRDKIDWQSLANTQIDLYKSDMTALRVLPPTNFAKVTDSIDIIEKFIQKLSRNGHLYEISGDHYFSVEPFLETLPLQVDEAISIFAERGGDPTRAGKKHPLDPVIWLANRNNEPGWQSKLGFGRPGWHVECTAIACEYLDDKNCDPIIDLQGGGSDLIFPHHFMSAQIVKAAYGRDFAKYFVHAAMIGLDGEKMSKSKGNLVFVSKLLEAKVDPMAIRWALLKGHYQEDRAWSNELLKTAELEINQIRRSLSQSEVSDSTELITGLIFDISNNLDTPAALKRLLDWSRKSENSGDVNQSGLVSRAIDSLLGLAL